MTREEAIKMLEYIKHTGNDKSEYKNDAQTITINITIKTLEPEPCEDAVSRNAIIQKLNTMNRYVSEELRLCDTDKKFPKNEVFIVDDVYEEIVENLPSAQSKIGKWILSGGYWRCSECKEKALLKLDKAIGGRREYEPVRSKHCPSCGTKMEEVKE